MPPRPLGLAAVDLGLFELEHEAAGTYDRALVRLRGSAAACNFPLSGYATELAEHRAFAAVRPAATRLVGQLCLPPRAVAPWPFAAPAARERWLSTHVAAVPAPGARPQAKETDDPRWAALTCEKGPDYDRFVKAGLQAVAAEGRARAAARPQEPPPPARAPAVAAPSEALTAAAAAVAAAGAALGGGEAAAAAAAADASLAVASESGPVAALMAKAAAALRAAAERPEPTPPQPASGGTSSRRRPATVSYASCDGQ